MKKLILAASFTLILPFTAQAQGEPTKLEACQSYSNLAESIMQVRQIGGDMATMISAMDDYQPAINLIKLAFDQPRYNTDRMQRKTIQDFKNEVFSACYK